MGKYPILRMIHCLIDFDDIKHSFIHRYDSPDRLTLENRNSDECWLPTVWEKIASKFNEPEYCPSTEGIPLLHPNFADPVTVPFSLVSSMTKATPKKCEEKFSSLTVAMKRVVADWEKSGQGDGGLFADDESNSISSADQDPCCNIGT